MQLTFKSSISNKSHWLWPLVLAACASQPPKQPNVTLPDVHQQHLASLANIKHFTLKSRIAVNANSKGFSGSIHWQHTKDDHIDIYSPFASKVASIDKNAQEVVLTTQDGNSIKASDAESLTELTLGWRLPLNGLNSWVLGKPTESTIEASTLNQTGQLSTLKQEGWDIQYLSYQSAYGTSLPEKINLRNDKVFIKLIIQEWQ